jgi:predicted nucleic acid-binding protein
MELIVDTNVAIAAVLRKGLTRNLIFNRILRLYCPEALFLEIEEHSKSLLGKSKLSLSDFEFMINLVADQITVLPIESYSDLKKEAVLITPDVDDWPFFAAALSKNLPLWSNDKGLKQQKKIKIVSTEELFKLLSRREWLV